MSGLDLIGLSAQFGSMCNSGSEVKVQVGAALRVDFLAVKERVEIDGGTATIAFTHRHVNPKSQKFKAWSTLRKGICFIYLFAQPVKAICGRRGRHAVAGNGQCKPSGVDKGIKKKEQQDRDHIAGTGQNARKR